MAELKTPTDLKYTRTDEWVRLDGNVATIGISDYAQHELNDIVFVELPDVGTDITKGAPFGVVESVKAASDLYAPVTGTITEVNTKLKDEPELINNDPYGRGWIVKIRLSGTADMNDLMDSSAYSVYNENR